MVRVVKKTLIKSPEHLFQQVCSKRTGGTQWLLELQFDGCGCGGKANQTGKPVSDKALDDDEKPLCRVVSAFIIVECEDVACSAGSGLKDVCVPEVEGPFDIRCVCLVV